MPSAEVREVLVYEDGRRWRWSTTDGARVRSARRTTDTSHAAIDEVGVVGRRGRVARRWRSVVCRRRWYRDPQRHGTQRLRQLLGRMHARELQDDVLMQLDLILLARTIEHLHQSMIVIAWLESWSARSDWLARSLEYSHPYKPVVADTT